MDLLFYIGIFNFEKGREFKMDYTCFIYSFPLSDASLREEDSLAT